MNKEKDTQKSDTAHKHPPSKRKKSIFDSIWDFFASVKVGVTIIVMLALTSALGTVYPQVSAIPSPNADVYYLQTYGELGDLYHKLGLSDMYGSWWFLSIVLLLGISLVIVSIDRGVPLYKSLKNQPVARKVIAIRADRLYSNKESAGESDLAALASDLKKRRYKVRTEQGAVLAEKGRLARFGAYVIHAGLIIIILGTFSRLIPGWYFNQMVWLKEGEQKYIKEVGFAVKNGGFTLEYYDDSGRVKKFETDLEVYENDQQVAKKHLIVNDPLDYKNTLVFQNSFDPQAMYKIGTAAVTDKQTGEKIGNFEIDFGEPKEQYQVGAYTLKVLNYFPDIKVDKDKGIFTNSRDPYNPGLMFEITGPGLEQPMQQWMMPSAPFVEQMLGKDYRFNIRLEQLTAFNMTGLLVHKDLGVPVVYTGCAVTLWGLVLVFYFQHRRIWARLEDGTVHIGGNAFKNWPGFAKEFNKAAAAIGAEPAVLKSRGNHAGQQKQPNQQHTSSADEGREETTQ